RVVVIDLAEVRSEDRLPAWEKAFARGLENLDRVESPGGVKTHFVEIKSVAGQFVVRSRLVDGSLGWVSPRMLEERTADRETLIRLAQSQIIREFGLAGTIVASDGDRSATVQLHGGNA